MAENDNGEGEKGGQGGEAGKGGPPDIEKLVRDAVERETGGLKRKNEELLGKLKKYSSLGDVDPDEVKTALEFRAKQEEEKKRSEGNFEQWRLDIQKKHSEEVAKRDSSLTKARERLGNAVKGRAIDEAIAAAEGIRPMLLPELSRFVRVSKLDDDDGEPAVEVVDERGSIRLNDKGLPMTVNELAAAYRADKVWAGAFRAPSTSGSGGRAGGMTAQGGVIRLSNADAKDTEKYRAAREQARKLGVPLEVGD